MKNLKNEHLFLFILALAAALTSFAGSCRAQDIPGLPPGTKETLDRLQATMYPPIVHNVTLSPDPPKTDTITEITAEIENDTNKTDDITTDAWVNYSSDGGATWNQADMERVGTSKVWKTELPAFPSGTEVIYGIRAKDTSTNILAETTCLVTSWPPDGDPCMFDLAVSDLSQGEKNALMSDDFDIVSLHGGVDEEYLYVEIKVDGIISAGTLTPVYAHVYGVAVQNPDRGNPNDIVSQGFIAVWIPMAEAFGFQNCMVLSRPANNVVMDNSNISCKTDGGSRLWMKINRKAIGNNPSKYIRILAADGAFTNITPLAGLYYDYTHVSSLSFTDRWFTVE